MTAVVRNVPSWPQWLRVEGAGWLFVLRTVTAMLCALAIAFRLDLSSPGSAAVTVSIIALPQAGMVLEKSFYRLLGTLLGAVVTLVLLALLVQQRDAFILAVAVWIGICTAASAWFRGFQAYGWLLCGYTTCLIGFPAFMDATHAFDIAVDRVTIVGVGILSAGIVNAVILPSRSSATLVDLVRRGFGDLVAYVDAATGTGDTAGGGADAATVRAAQGRFSRDLAALEALRSSSAFEDAMSRVRSRRLVGFIGSFMFASSRLHLLHRHLEELRDRGLHEVLSAAEPRLDDFRRALRVAGRVPATALEAQPLAAQLQFLAAGEPLPDATTQVLLDEAIGGARILAAAYADMHSLRSRGIGLPGQPPRFAADWLQAGLAGLRAALVVLATCAFWIASAWPDGFSVTLLGTVGCALFSSAPDPKQAAKQMCKGFLLAFPALVVCYSLALPAADDFYTLGLALAPFLAFGAWLMTRPGQVLTGSGFFLMFLTGLNLTALMSYDFLGMINGALGLLLGIGVATLSLAVIVPADRGWRPARAAARLLDSLQMARTDPLENLQPRFEARVRDLSMQLAALRASGASAAHDDALGLVILETGDALIRLRSYSRCLNEPVLAALAPSLDASVTAVVRRDAKALRVLDAPLAELQTEIAASVSGDPAPFIAAMSVLRLALKNFARALDA